MNFSNCTTEDSPGDSVYTPGKAILSLTLSLLALTAAVINSLVITAIVVSRKLHHPANYLIGSLAVTDLLVAVLVMPFSIFYIVREVWVMGEVACDFWLSVDVTCCTCSILHLAAIAVDRYRAITDAVEYARKRTSRRAAAMIAGVWVISVLVSVPPLAWRHQQEKCAGICIIQHNHTAFAIYSTFGAFYLPLAVILILYYKIYRTARNLYHRRGTLSFNRQEMTSNVLPGGLHREPQSPHTLSPREKSFSEPSTEADHAHITPKSPQGKSFLGKTSRGQCFSMARERKAAGTLGLILGAFIVCWLPFFLKEVIVSSCSTCSTSKAGAHFLAWLGYLNSLINPLIYTIFSEDFKKAFKKLCQCKLRC